MLALPESLIVRTDPDSERHRGLSYLLVPMDQPGIEVRPIVQITGGTEFNEVFFDDAETDADLVIGGAGNGWAVAMGTLGFERGASTLAMPADYERQLRGLVAALDERGALEEPVVREKLEKLIVDNSPSGGDGSAFDLVDSWFERDRARSLSVLADIVTSGALDEKNQRVRDPQRLLLQFLALSLKRARELRAVHEIVARGGGQKEILEEAGIARPFLPRIRKQYQSCDAPRTNKIIETLIEMDWQLKSGAGASPVELIERAVVSV